LLGRRRRPRTLLATEVTVQARTRHTPTFGVARLLLAPGEPVSVTPGAVLATSYGVAVEPQRHGGLLKSIAKATGAANVVSSSTCIAPLEGGWVDVAPSLPGDLRVVELDGQASWCVTKDRWLACASTVALDTQWPGFRMVFGGDSGFLAHAAGRGPLVLSCCGALDVITLAVNELVTVGAGYLVAYIDTLQVRLRAISPGVEQSVRTGEGLVFDFAGPGQLITQTRNPRGLAAWLQANGPNAKG
jgi:uncharacterized protein (TIGR00266 family)